MDRPNKTQEQLAIVSLVLFVVGLFAIVVVWLPISVMEHLTDATIQGIYVGTGLLVWIPAIACGHISLSRIRKSDHLKGKGFAYAGLAFSYVAMALLIALIALALVLGAGSGK